MSDEKETAIAEENQGDLKTNKKSKDSVFVDLFRNPENVLRLYKELHPEDTEVSVKDIDIRTISAVLVSAIYHDLGFIVRGKPKKSGKNKKNEITYKPNEKFVVLVDAQSKWNPNMTLRLLIYLAKTYQQYLIDTQQSEHSSAKVSLPKLELYVIYTGDDWKSVSSEISFKDDYFDGDAPKVKILCKEDTATLSGQYIGFCKIYNKQKALHNDSIKCAEETVRICIEKGYLSEYLTTHQKEVISMMRELFDQETVQK
ncbi:MAG: hypothetical protein IKP69_00900 [Oscillospiraceae bacterium]|nr:hypothetical protein [Oscillospiraceae bacterium]